MKETWNDIVKDLVVDQRMDCQYCFDKSSTQLAHAIVYKRVYNNRKSHKNINVRENALPCCDDCASFSETRKGREHAWKVLCDWYGEERIQSWYDELGLKVKEVFE